MSAVGVDGEKRPFRLMGLAPSAWLFAIRIWMATVAALGAAFWLQLESASSAAVCVGILALSTRGQAYEKAFYRLVGTLIGVAASIAIAGLFGGVRDPFILACAAWLAGCVYVAGRLDGNRAYGAVLSGYTVALVAVSNIDTPQDVFSTGMNRGAAIIIGVLAVMLFNDLLAAPNLYHGLLARLEATHAKVIELARRSLCNAQAEAGAATRLLGEIVQFRVDITALPTEATTGRVRAAAARVAVAAMAREVAAARAVAGVLRDSGAEAKELADTLSALLDERPATEAERLDKRMDAVVDEHDAASPLFVAASAARILVAQNRRTRAALSDLRGNRGDGRGPRLPIFRPREAALRNALRVFIGFLAGAALFVVTGWPSTSFSMVLLGAVLGLSATAPNPRLFARAAVIAMPSAFALAGVIEFLVLGGVDAFPLLAIGLAPAVIGAALLVASGKPKIAPIGSLLLVFTPVLMSLSNPQSYNPQIYLVQGGLAVTAVIILALVLATVLPTNDDQKRAWILRSLRSDFHHALVAPRWGRDPDEVAFRDADRVAQLGALQPPSVGDLAADLRHGLQLAALTSAAWRVRIAVADPRLPKWAQRDGRAALSAESPAALRAVADRLSASRAEISEADLPPCRWAASTLALTATIIEHSPLEISELNEERSR